MGEDGAGSSPGSPRSAPRGSGSPVERVERVERVARVERVRALPLEAEIATLKRENRKLKDLMKRVAMEMEILQNSTMQVQINS